MNSRWCGLIFAVCTGNALAADPPRFIEYQLRAEGSLQSQSNPFRLTNRLSDRSDTVRTFDISGAAIVPLASNDTRLLLSGSLGDAHYDVNPQLGYQPRQLDAVFQWRYGRLFKGSAGLSSGLGLNPFLNLSAPFRDVITTRSYFADAGLRVTEDLTAPAISVNHRTRRYEFGSNATLYDRDEDVVQAAIQYTGINNSLAQIGVLQSQIDYVGRTPQLISQIDNRYRDREVFADVRYNYSPKTSLYARLGYRQREYRTLSERNVNLVTGELRARWQATAKTRLNLELWQRPYANEEIPGILYSTLRGARASVRWQNSEKLFASFNVIRENQSDTRRVGDLSGSSQGWRYGPRVEWHIDRNVMLVADGWRERVKGQNYPSFSNNVVRLTLVLLHDNGGVSAPGRLIRSRDCEGPRYVESTSCYD